MTLCISGSPLGELCLLADMVVGIIVALIRGRVLMPRNGWHPECCQTHFKAHEEPPGQNYLALMSKVPTARSPVEPYDPRPIAHMACLCPVFWERVNRSGHRASNYLKPVLLLPIQWKLNFKRSRAAKQTVFWSMINTQRHRQHRALSQLLYQCSQSVPTSQRASPIGSNLSGACV